MTDTRAIGQELQEQIMDAVRKSQETVVEAIKTWADTVQSITPSLPAVPAVPFADKLPNPGELVSSAYDFAEKLLASQRKFAEDVLQATAPVLTSGAKSGGSTTKSGGASTK
jgi:hypothetical protein